VGCRLPCLRKPASSIDGLCLLIVALLSALQLTEEWANSLLPGGGVAGLRELLRENQQAEREAAQRERIADAFTSAGGCQACLHAQAGVQAAERAGGHAAGHSQREALEHTQRRTT
jgi:hypothetical protein